jgi:hypothetical protein
MPLNKSWHDYNKSLIERGRILMDLGFLKSQGNEIRKMNGGKVGAPFEYSHTWIAEIVFSSIKRVLGEHLLSKKFKAQKVEAGLKVMLYNKFMISQT